MWITVTVHSVMGGTLRITVHEMIVWNRNKLWGITSSVPILLIAVISLWNMCFRRRTGIPCARWLVFFSVCFRRFVLRFARIPTRYSIYVFSLIPVDS